MWFPIGCRPCGFRLDIVPAVSEWAPWSPNGHASWVLNGHRGTRIAGGTDPGCRMDILVSEWQPVWLHTGSICGFRTDTVGAVSEWGSGLRFPNGCRGCGFRMGILSAVSDQILCLRFQNGLRRNTLRFPHGALVVSEWSLLLRFPDWALEVSEWAPWSLNGHASWLPSGHLGARSARAAWRPASGGS